MTTRKDIRRVIIPPRYAEAFDASKAHAEEVTMCKLTDAQQVARLVCWALDQMGKKDGN